MSNSKEWSKAIWAFYLAGLALAGIACGGLVWVLGWLG